MNIPADVRAYNAVISACSKAGRWALGREFLLDMKRRNVAPDAYTYSSLIRCAWEGPDI